MKKNENNVLVSAIVLVILIISLIFLSFSFNKASYLAAEVNGEQITLAEINKQYDLIPSDFKKNITKETILQNTIDVVLLRQEAEKRGLVLTDDEFNSMLDEALLKSNVTKKDLETRLKEQGMSLEDIKTQFIIRTLLNGVVGNASAEKQQEIIKSFVKGLRSKADITVYMK